MSCFHWILHHDSLLCLENGARIVLRDRGNEYSHRFTIEHFRPDDPEDNELKLHEYETLPEARRRFKKYSDLLMNKEKIKNE